MATRAFHPNDIQVLQQRLAALERELALQDQVISDLKISVLQLTSLERGTGPWSSQTRCGCCLVDDQLDHKLATDTSRHAEGLWETRSINERQIHLTQPTPTGHDHKPPSTYSKTNFPDNGSPLSWNILQPSQRKTSHLEGSSDASDSSANTETNDESFKGISSAQIGKSDTLKAPNSRAATINQPSDTPRGIVQDLKPTPSRIPTKIEPTTLSELRNANTSTPVNQFRGPGLTPVPSRPQNQIISPTNDSKLSCARPNIRGHIPSGESATEWKQVGNNHQDRIKSRHMPMHKYEPIAFAGDAIDRSAAVGRLALHNSIHVRDMRLGHDIPGTLDASTRFGAINRIPMHTTQPHEGLVHTPLPGPVGGGNTNQSVSRGLMHSKWSPAAYQHITPPANQQAVPSADIGKSYVVANSSTSNYSSGLDHTSDRFIGSFEGGRGRGRLGPVNATPRRHVWMPSSVGEPIPNRRIGVDSPHGAIERAPAVHSSCVAKTSQADIPVAHRVAGVSDDQERAEPYDGNDGDQASEGGVIIGNIPTSMKLCNVLDKVRVGRVKFAYFFDMQRIKTIPKSSTNAALVIFSRQQDALTFCARSKVQPIVFQPNSPHPFTASVVRLPAQTLMARCVPSFDRRPGPAVTRAIFVDDPGHDWSPDTLITRLQAYQTYNQLGRRVLRPLRAGRTADDALFFEFANIEMAKTARDMISRDQVGFGSVNSGYLRDPCAVDAIQPDEFPPVHPGYQQTCEANREATDSNAPLEDHEENLIEL